MTENTYAIVYRLESIENEELNDLFIKVRKEKIKRELILKLQPLLHSRINTDRFLSDAMSGRIFDYNIINLAVEAISYRLGSDAWDEYEDWWMVRDAICDAYLK